MITISKGLPHLRGDGYVDSTLRMPTSGGSGSFGPTPYPDNDLPSRRTLQQEDWTDDQAKDTHGGTLPRPMKKSPTNTLQQHLMPTETESSTDYSTPEEDENLGDEPQRTSTEEQRQQAGHTEQEHGNAPKGTFPELKRRTQPKKTPNQTDRSREDELPVRSAL